jgi:hypothetical protein
MEITCMSKLTNQKETFENPKVVKDFFIKQAIKKTIDINGSVPPYEVIFEEALVNACQYINKIWRESSTLINR